MLVYLCEESVFKYISYVVYTLNFNNTPLVVVKKGDSVSFGRFEESDYIRARPGKYLTVNR